MRVRASPRRYKVNAPASGFALPARLDVRAMIRTLHRSDRGKGRRRPRHHRRCREWRWRQQNRLVNPIWSLPGCRWRRRRRQDAAPDLGLRRYPGSGLAPAARARRCPGKDGRLRRDRFRSSSWAIIGLRRDRPCAVHGIERQTERKAWPRAPTAFGRLPSLPISLWPNSIRLEQVALDGDAIYWSETQPQKKGRTFVYRVGADGELGMRDARRRQRFQRSHARSRVWRRLVRRQRRRHLFLEQQRSAALSPGSGGPPSPITPAPAGAAADSFALRRWRHRPTAGTHGLRQRGSHWQRRRRPRR